MKGRRPSKARKSRVFVGCEGKSEVEYIRLIGVLCDRAKLSVHVIPDNLAPHGDPLSRVENAIRRIKYHQRNRDNFVACFLLLDEDQAISQPQRAERARLLAQQHSISLIWQNPCHEAVLLRHFENHSHDRPPSTLIANQQLKAIWPDYIKGMDWRELSKRLDLQSVHRVANVETNLADLLRRIGLIPPASHPS